MNDLRPSYYDIADFPDLQKLSENWKIIREEFNVLNAPIMKIDRFNKVHEEVVREVTEYIQKGNEYGWVLGAGTYGGNYDWLQYGLVANDVTIPFVSPKLKNTIKMLENIKGIKVAALVKLKSLTALHCHQHPGIFEENLLQLHLPIDTALTNNYAYLNVRGEFRQHVCGEPIIFDGSLDHFALNESNKDRTILYIEFNKKLMVS